MRVCVCVCVSLFTHIFFIHSFVLGYLSCFCTLAILNNAAMNIGVHVSFWISGFVFFRYIPRSGIAGSYSSFSLSFLRNFHSVFHSGCNNLHAHSELFLTTWTILSIEISFWPYSSRLMRNTYFFCWECIIFFHQNHVGPVKSNKSVRPGEWKILLKSIEIMYI